MSFLEDLRSDRRKFIEGWDRNKGDIDLDIVEDFYPDKAHFIYELLQNAEDARATTCDFTLSRHQCTFEHDGAKQLDEADVRALTGIHNSTKSNRPDQIGKFGIGFKSVFAYTLSPCVFSDEYTFRIERYVMPEPIAAQDVGRNTRFVIPFDHPKKGDCQAFDEIRDGLCELSGAALLFLNHIKSVSWQVEGGQRGAIWRREWDAEGHVEVVTQIDGRSATSLHFLRFAQPVSDCEVQHVAVAFELGFIKDDQLFDCEQPIAKQLKIVPADPGRVAVYFPAKKEASGLRFHVHAPFVPELSRASIKETAVNDPLFEQLAELVAGSLPTIRDIGLLTTEFLGVLPNEHDNIQERYKPIRSAVVEAMNAQPLTPTKAGSHAAAQQLVQAAGRLKNLLNDDDLQQLISDYRMRSPQWVKSAALKNSNADRFLEGLDIRRWDIEQFVEAARRQMYRFRDRSVEWHQELYAMLYDWLHENTPDRADRRNKLRCIELVRRSDGRYKTGEECFFPCSEMTADEVLPAGDGGREELFPCVDDRLYTDGQNEDLKEKVRLFLKAVGVREVGIAEIVEKILEERYSLFADDPVPLDVHKKDLERFMSLVEEHPNEAARFKDYKVFETARGSLRLQPECVFLDTPFMDTGLSAYFDVVDGKYALSGIYAEMGLPPERIGKFAEALGACTRLEITKVSCTGNPEWEHLSNAPGCYWTASRCDIDYTILDLKRMLQQPNMKRSHLVWRTLRELDACYLQACYQRNAKSGSREAPSQLVHTLRDASWIPQKLDRFVRPAEADRDLLPEGFPFDPGWQWAKAVCFGENLTKRVEERCQRRHAVRDLGFENDEALERARWFACLPRDVQDSIMRERQNVATIDLPDHQSSNPERRAARVAEQAAEAPDRTSVKRTRSVSVEIEAVKEKAKSYLRDQYTCDGQMICQVCKEKQELPFKLDNGSYYFEAVEFLGEGDLKKRHHQNYLALCPNHAAMFRFANGSRDRLKPAFLELNDEQRELPVTLAGKDTTIYFTAKHILDLKSVIGANDGIAIDGDGGGE